MSDVASFLGAAVSVAVNRLARDHPALARQVNWSVERVKKNTALALDLARKNLSRQAVVEHFTQSQRPGAAPAAHRKQPGILERGAAAVRQELGREAWAASHPTEALAKYIHNQRLLPGERHLARANDIVGGSIAGMAADTLDGLGKIADLNHRYLQGGILEDPFVKRGLIPPPVKAADQAARWSAPLHREAELRPPTTLPGQALAAVPRVVSVALAPELIGTALLATQGVGAASHRARQTGAPDNLRTDVGIAATGAIDALVGRLLKTGRYTDAFRFIERQPAAVRGHLQDLVIRTFARSAGGAVVSSGQTTLDNAVAKASYDPNRRLDEGLGESAAFGGALGSLGRRGSQTKAALRPPLPSPPTPPQQPGSFTIPRAGLHGELRLRGFESHHIPSNSSSPLPRAKGPSVLLSSDDHRRTGSYGNTNASKDFRRREGEAFESEGFAASQDIGIEDLRRILGEHAEPLIDELLKRSKAEGYRK